MPKTNIKALLYPIFPIYFSSQAIVADPTPKILFGVGKTKDSERNLKEVMKYTNIGVRSTVDLPMFDRQNEIVEYYHGLGVKNLALNPITTPIKRTAKTVDNINQDDPMLFAKGFVKAYKLAEQLKMDLTNSMTFNFDEVTHYGCRSCLPMPQLNPYGSVSSCDLACYFDTRKELRCFLYGKWDEAKKEIIYDLAQN